jgi:hypothetical protein
MKTQMRNHPFRRWGCALLLSALGLSSLAAPAGAADKPSWPASVQARYSLRFNGIEVGRMSIVSNTTAKTYSITGSGKVSVLFGAFEWSASSAVSGVIEKNDPAPTVFAADWQQNKKGGAVKIGYQGRIASDVTIKPAQRIKPDTVPLKPADKLGTVDPMSALLMLTKADGRPPCDRRVPIFDGNQRYDIVLTPKSPRGGASRENVVTCRIRYAPIAGHRNNEDTRSYAANGEAEIVLARVKGSDMMVPYAVTIPTQWGTGSMVAEKIEVDTGKPARAAAIN